MELLRMPGWSNSAHRGARPGGREQRDSEKFGETHEMSDEMILSLDPSEWWRHDPTCGLAAQVMRNELARHENFRRPRRSSIQRRRDSVTNPPTRKVAQLSYKKTVHDGSAASEVGPHSADVRGGTKER
jgi:hypothetical protein